MRIMIAGGGTGGHIFPGIAIAEEFKLREPMADVLFVGTEKGIESRLVPKEGYAIRFIRSEGIVGVGSIKGIKAMLKVPLSLKDSHNILERFRPDIAIGVGGYSSGPLVLTAFLMSIPTLIHEQNSVPGLTNRLLSNVARGIAVTYLDSMEFFPKEKTFLTGNPIRSGITRGDRQRAYRMFGLHSGLFTVFVFGGSRGAHSINMAVLEASGYLSDLREKLQFLHQTGEKDYEEVKDFYRSRDIKGTVLPFIFEMPEAYAVSDLVISRAGASTLAEITACGKASILIPYPFAARNHQEINAKKLWDLGAAQLILDRELKGKNLSEIIRHLFENPDAVSDMEKASRSLGRPDAAQRIVDLAMGLIRNK